MALSKGIEADPEADQADDRGEGHQPARDEQNVPPPLGPGKVRLEGGAQPADAGLEWILTRPGHGR